MFVQFKGSGKKQLAYVAKSYRTSKGGKTSTDIVEKLGYLEDIAAAHPGVDPKEWAKQRARELTILEKSQSAPVKIELNPALSIRRGRRKMKGGMLPLIPLLHGWAGVGGICKEITARSNFKFNLTDIVSMLVYGRILCPDSKLSTLRKSESFIATPGVDLKDVYLSLGVLARESDFIQQQIYRNTVAGEPRNTGVIYYDCSNYYFEIEQDDKDSIDENGNVNLGLRKYGHSKENRPNPIVQLGLFMDADGMPLSFCINPGNTAENQTLQPLEEKLADNFGLSDFVCCTDGGLGSRSNRKYNTTEGRNYITVQSLKDKKCDPHIQEWALSDGNWTVPGYPGEYTLSEASELLGERFEETTLYKERYDIVGKGAEQMEEHFIVTYSEKYARYQRATRAGQVERARKKLARGEVKKAKSPNDCMRFVSTLHTTDNGDVAGNRMSSIDQSKIDDEARFDGLYALATSLEDTPAAILRANHFRYEIEALFRITKTDLELRPIYLQRKDRIIGHFIICFMALLIIKRLQKMLGKYSVEQILQQLRSMDYLLLEAHGYIPDFDRTDMTDELQTLTNQKLDAQIIAKPAMRAILRALQQS